MIDERDIWGSAKIMVDRHGDEAAIKATGACLAFNARMSRTASG